MFIKNDNDQVYCDSHDGGVDGEMREQVENVNNNSIDNDDDQDDEDDIEEMLNNNNKKNYYNWKLQLKRIRTRTRLHKTR